MSYYKEQVKASISEDSLENLRLIADFEGKSMSSVMREILEPTLLEKSERIRDQKRREYMKEKMIDFNWDDITGPDFRVEGGEEHWTQATEEAYKLYPNQFMRLSAAKKERKEKLD